MLTLANRYEKQSFSHDYIIGYDYKGKIYMVVCKMSDILLAIKEDSASQKNGGGKSLRFAPSVACKKSFLSTAQPLMDTEKFLEIVKSSIYNKGEIFEKIVTEKAGQKWEKDNKPFYTAGDIEIDGKPYQIKFQKATFCTEKQLEKLEK